MQASQEIWLSVWTRAEKVVVDPSMRYYMSVYVAIGMGGIAIGFVRGIFLLIGSLTASQVRICSLLINCIGNWCQALCEHFVGSRTMPWLKGPRLLTLLRFKHAT